MALAGHRTFSLLASLALILAVPLLPPGTLLLLILGMIATLRWHRRSARS